jgi:hypothetical protein
MALSGCGHVTIKDAEWCGDMGDDGASCFHTLTDDTRDLPKAEWDKERFGSVCTKSENFANMKTAIEELCHKAKGLCTYETRKKLNAFFEHTDQLNQMQEARLQ